MTPTPSATPVRFQASINFQPSSAVTYTGFAVDAGAIYGLRSNGLSYGWSANNTSNVVDRNSSRSADQRYDTLAFMQRNGTFTWEISVPNGVYSVRLVAGDATTTGNAFRLNLEGALALSGTQTSSVRWIDRTVTVSVTDGRLTLSNATGTSNNKICFIEITQQ